MRALAIGGAMQRRANVDPATHRPTHHRLPPVRPCPFRRGVGIGRHLEGPRLRLQLAAEPRVGAEQRTLLGRTGQGEVRGVVVE